MDESAQNQPDTHENGFSGGKDGFPQTGFIQEVGYFEKFDDKSREEQMVGFQKMMDDLKEYITENKNMEEYFNEQPYQVTAFNTMVLSF